MSRDHVERFVAICRKLHEHHAAGTIDSPEAEALCDESDPIWYAMTDAEREECCRWSGDNPPPDGPNE